MKIIQCRASKSHHCQTVSTFLRSPFQTFYYAPIVPLVTPTSSPIISASRKQEVVLFVGYPCLGKSTFFKRYFLPEGYLHINQDTLKSRDRCVKAVKKALESGQSCVVGPFHSINLSFVLWPISTIDNTNRDIVARKAYLDLCSAHNVSLRYVSCLQDLVALITYLV